MARVFGISVHVYDVLDHTAADSAGRYTRFAEKKRSKLLSRGVVVRSSGMSVHVYGVLEHPSAVSTESSTRPVEKGVRDSLYQSTYLVS